MQELQTIFTETIVNICFALIALLGAYGTLCLKKLSDKIKAETEKLEEDKKKELIIEALYRLEDVANKTVSSLEQTTAEAIRESFEMNSEEKKEQFKKVFKDAYGQVITTLEPEYEKVLRDSLGDFETYVKNVIEDKVRVIKEERYARV